MDALSRATPAMLTEGEKSAPAERPAAKRKAQAASRRKLGWRSSVAISALVLTAGVSVYALLGHGGLRRLGKIAGMSQTGQTPSAILSNGAWVNVPLPRRRPAALRAEQGPGHGSPAAPQIDAGLSRWCRRNGSPGQRRGASINSGPGGSSGFQADRALRNGRAWTAFIGWSDAGVRSMGQAGKSGSQG